MTASTLLTSGGKVKFSASGTEYDLTIDNTAKTITAEVPKGQSFETVYLKLGGSTAVNIFLREGIARATPGTGHTVGVQAPDAYVGTSAAYIQKDSSTSGAIALDLNSKSATFDLTVAALDPSYETTLTTEYTTYKVTIKKCIGIFVISERGVVGWGFLKKIDLYKVPYVTGGIELPVTKDNAVMMNCFVDSGTQYGVFFKNGKLKLYTAMTSGSEVSANTAVTVSLDFIDY